MANWTVYDSEGMIVLLKNGSEPSAGLIPPGGGYLEGLHDQKAAYVLGGEVVERPQFSIDHAVSVAVGEVVTFSGVPTGTTIKYQGLSAIADGSDIEWSSAVEGSFVFVFELTPYQQKEVTVAVN